nr:hypothetical protein [Tanacetum cinerariifolium]
MDQQNFTLAKILILDTGKFKQWKFRIQQYIQHEYYALSEVIEFGDSYEAPQQESTPALASEGYAKKKGRTIAFTTEDMQKRSNDVKARTTLLLAFLDEHHLRFSKYKTAQDLWAAIMKTFSGNEATKKTKKNLLKQQYGNFKAEAKNSSGNEEVNIASIPTASTQVSTAGPNIDEDGIEEMDIKWNMALLSMRANRFWKKTGKKISIQGIDVAGFNKSKVECFNCHKIGHFARECRAPRSQDRGRRDNYRQGSKVDEQAPKALMAIDEVGWDCSFMANEEENLAFVADEEALTEFALMAKSSSSNEVFDNSLCSQACLSQVEARLAEYKSQEIKFCEKIRAIEFDLNNKNIKIEYLTNELENAKKEKDDLDSKLTCFQSAFKDLDNLLESQRSDKNKEGLGYSAVPPLLLKPSPAIESKSDDLQNRNSFVTETGSSSSTILSKPVVKLVKAAERPKETKIDKVETAKKSAVNMLKCKNFVIMNKACFNYGNFDHLSYDYGKWVEMVKPRTKYNTHKSIPPRTDFHKADRSSIRRNRPNMNVARPKWTSLYKPAHSYVKRPFEIRSAVGTKFQAPRVPTVNRKFPTVNRKFHTVNRKFPTGNSKVSTADLRNKGKAVKSLACWIWKPKQNSTNKGSNSNSVSVMFKKYTYIDTQGRLKSDSGCSRHITGNISYLSDYEPFDGGYVSFSQGGCKITGKETIKIAKASLDESMLWHRRLGHLNFKTMNRLVRHNLVKGLPSKCFENDHTCTACLKGMQHKASLTDDFFRFTWTFFLKTKDETSDILRNFITKIENMKDLKVKIIRVLVNKSQNKTPYELFNSRTPAIGFLKPFGCHVMILNTLDHLEKFEAKVDEGYFIGYSMSSKAFRFHEALLESSLSNAQDAGNADAPESSGNPNPTATTTNPLADQIETLTVETPIPTVSSLVPTAILSDSPEPSSDTRLISKRVIRQDETPSLDNITTLTNKFDDILGVTTSTVDSHGDEADVSNMEITITASPTHTLKIHNDHLKSQIIGPVDTLIQTKNKSKEMEEQKPKKISDALKDPGWVEAIQEELLQFKIQNVWVLVDCPEGEEGIDYEEVFAPVARIEAIRLFLAYASFMGFTVYQMDVKSAFLYGTIDEEVYVMQPPRFYDPQFPDKVYKVEKVMGTIDQTLFIRKHKGDFLLVQVYVDDIIFGSSNPQLCREFEALMHDKFQMSVMANTPMDKEIPWGKDGPGKNVELHLYRSMIGSLMYLTESRPDIMFVVCACARHQVTPKECHLHAVKRIFRYLKGHPKLGLWYPRECLFDLVAYSDSDYGGGVQDRKSTTGGHHFIRGCFEKKLISVDHIHTDDNVADLLTKPFDAGRFKYLVYGGGWVVTMGIVFNGLYWDSVVNMCINYPHGSDSEQMIHEFIHVYLVFASVYVWIGVKTLDAETKILATIDGKPKTIFESSIRRNLKLNDEAGISSLPAAELFKNLTLMGCNISPNQKFTFQKGQFSHQWKYLIHTIMQCLSPKSTGFNEFSSNTATALVCLATNRVYNFSKMIFDGEGSGTPTEPHHTPTPKTPQSPQHEPSSSSLLPSLALPTAADEPASPLGDDSQWEAFPTVSSLKAEQNRETILKTSSLPHDLTPRVTSLAADEGSMQQQINKLTDLCTRLQRQQTEMASMIAAQDIEIASLKARIKMVEDKDGGVIAQSVDDAPIKGRSLEKGEEAAVERDTERGSDDTEEMVTVLTSLDAATILTSRGVQVSVPPAVEVATISIPPASEIPTGSGVVPTASPIFTTATVATHYSRRKGKEKMVESETPKKKKLQEQMDAQQSKPLTKKQQREFYTSVLRSHVGWKTKHFKGMSLEEIKEKFDPVWKQIQDFVPIGSKEKGERFKRKGIRLEQDSAKKVKTSEEVSKEDLKTMMQLVPVEEVYVEALQLWALVKETLSIKPATMERRLYDTCGVHCVSTKDQEIFMMVEKDYPLRKGLAIVMISKKL